MMASMRESEVKVSPELSGRAARRIPARYLSRAYRTRRCGALCSEHRRDGGPDAPCAEHRRDRGPDVSYVPHTPHVLYIR
ncbi:hypothetical protein [Paraburkholderia elongata]|uniref:Uncharacterized protein n=1 Tax=Paraburkholderia elongata TaxID=2675747 RepID=A0A972SSA6_9BURK|nr:hypothetical protein [Paraburkholderia elongata]NPT61680.1 hypothetical protein [Paraburkholderia elongata]NPT61989.1 hypothetical protein [Paraburkholderia elongata]